MNKERQDYDTGRQAVCFYMLFYSWLFLPIFGCVVLGGLVVGWLDKGAKGHLRDVPVSYPLQEPQFCINTLDIHATDTGTVFFLIWRLQY